MKKYRGLKITILIILAVITIGAIGYGINRHVFTFVSGCGGPADVGPIENKEIAITDMSFDSVQVNMDISQLTIQKGDELSLVYEMPSGLVPDVTVDRNTLVIKSRNKLHFSFPHFNQEYKLILTIPENKDMDELDIDIDLGDVRIYDVNCKKLAVKADCGNVQIKGIVAKDIALEAKFGNIEGEKIACKDFNGTLNAGNLHMNGLQAETITAEADMGNVEFNDTFFKSGNFEADLGDIQIRGDAEEIEAKCDLGGIVIETKSSEDEMKLKLKVSLGEITVNGRKW